MKKLFFRRRFFTVNFAGYLLISSIAFGQDSTNEQEIREGCHAVFLAGSLSFALIIGNVVYSDIKRERKAVLLEMRKSKAVQVNSEFFYLEEGQVWKILADGRSIATNIANVDRISVYQEKLYAARTDGVFVYFPDSDLKMKPAPWEKLPDSDSVNIQ